MEKVADDAIEELSGVQFVLACKETDEVVFGRGVKRFHRNKYTGPPSDIGHYSHGCLFTGRDLVKEYEKVHGVNPFSVGLTVKEVDLDAMVNDYKQKQRMCLIAMSTLSVRCVKYFNEWFDSLESLMMSIPDTSPLKSGTSITKALTIEVKWEGNIRELRKEVDKAKKELLKWIFVKD